MGGCITSALTGASAVEVVGAILGSVIPASGGGGEQIQGADRATTDLDRDTQRGPDAGTAHRQHDPIEAGVGPQVGDGYRQPQVKASMQGPWLS
jgi:hypothetical protein